MKSLHKTGWLIAFLFVCLNIQPVSAQTTGSGDITWLGLDFSQAKFIGPASQFKDAGEITNDEFRDKYTVSWNQLFIDEQKKFNVAEMVHRPDVKYALDVTNKANSTIKKEFFGSSPNDFKTIDEKKIGDLVSRYDFQGKTGNGLLFFVEGMSKGLGEAGAWVTLVDMKAKKVLSTTYKTGKAGGFGFRNYWAKSWFNIMKEAKSDFKK
ncbi:MAG TPA: hypothetical protein VNS58_05195 [Puia sp.]|nr:hypothetical protein [Puia sp.]